ncbi:unnamed protein product [Prorocentrum cordatum]|uniref:Protein-tyrosine sulfotransferase n=1 Tax=Prorocentrum cordatum TaxID=2364126 RepID=A0ABN9T4P9_9DINO|nr:unnamed protein product [Polarella glacialis]
MWGASMRPSPPPPPPHPLPPPPRSRSGSRSMVSSYCEPSYYPGGPSQMAGAHALASKRSVPSTRATRSDLAGKAQRLDRWPFHLKARILLPRAKLAFCYMPKVASNQIATLFGELNRVHGEKWPWEPWEYSGPAKLNIDWSRVTRENGWKFAFLHRDPLARYLSAFGSKCMVNAKYGNVEGAGKDCLGKVQWTALPMDKMVEAFEERVRFDALVGRPVNNSHWFPMIKNLRACGIDKFHPDIVDFKGSIDEDANSVVRRMFEATGVIQAYPNASALIDKHFPRQTVGGHSSKSHNRQDEFYRNASTVQAVARLYEEDFQRLRLKVSPQMHSILMG